MKNDGALVSVCIVTYNRRDSLDAALRSVEKQSWPVSEVVVVDNHSDDGTGGLLADMHPEVRHLFQTTNLGCPPARNVGMAACSGEFIANLDDDGEFQPDAIAEALRIMESCSRVGIVMMNIFEEGFSRTPHVPDRELLPFFSGGACLIRKAILEECGYYDSNIFRQGEEYDLSIRMFEKGYDIRYAEKSIMLHYPPSVLKATPRIIALGGVSKSLALLKYAPLRALPLDLLRRVFGHCWLLTRMGAPWEAMKMLSSIIRNVPRAIRSRQVCPVGYFRSRELHRKYKEM